MTTTTKKTYRVRNWSQYNAALTKRGSLTLWISEEALAAWTLSEKTGQRGASDFYSDQAIECLLVLRSIYHLGFRQLVGFAESVFGLMNLCLRIPDYSTICRRQKDLDILCRVDPSQTPAHIVIDSTGLKLYGQGEWHVRQHGISKRRQWRKLHLGVDEATMEIVAVVATQNNVHDTEVLDELLAQVDRPIKQISADGAYDTWKTYTMLEQRGIRAVIPPRRGSTIKQHRNATGPPRQRNEHLRQIRSKGRAVWKRSMNYHRRSLAETTMYRYKQILGEKLRARRFASQVTEMHLNCAILNRMTALGMPESYVVT